MFLGDLDVLMICNRMTELVEKTEVPGQKGSEILSNCKRLCLDIFLM